MKTRPSITLALLLSLAGGTSVWADGAPDQIDGAVLLSGDPVESSQYLGTTYKSETDGFRLTPPAGSRLVQRQGVDLVSYIVDAKSWGGSLQRLSFVSKPKAAAGAAAVTDKSDEPMTMDELLTKIKAELPKTFKGVQILQQKAIQFDGKTAVRFDLSMQAELGAGWDPTGGDHRMGQNAPKAGNANLAADQVVGLFRQQLIIQNQVDDKGRGVQYLFLTLYAPLKDRTAATKTFEAMLPEFSLYDPKTLIDRRVKSAAAGREWLASHDAEDFLKKMNNQPQYFMLQVDTRNVGFIQLAETSKVPASNGSMVDVERGGRKGILMTVKFGSFGENAVSYGQIDEFWGFSRDARGQELGQYSEWNVITKSQIKDMLPLDKVVNGQPNYRMLTPWLQETGNISQDSPRQRPHIIVSFGGDNKEHLPVGVNVTVPEGNAPAPLPKVLEYSWPRFVDVTKPSEMSFTTYDSHANKLALRNLITTGKAESIKVNGKSMQAYKCIDEIDPNNTTLWVTKDGQIQLMKTSDQSIMQPTTLDVINKTWPNRPSE